jgi:hypothetical protein
MARYRCEEDLRGEITTVVKAVEIAVAVVVLVEKSVVKAVVVEVTKMVVAGAVDVALTIEVVETGLVTSEQAEERTLEGNRVCSASNGAARGMSDMLVTVMDSSAVVVVAVKVVSLVVVVVVTVVSGVLVPITVVCRMTEVL